MSNKVYTVVGYDLPEYSEGVVGMFSSRDSAEALLAAIEVERGFNYPKDEYKIDEWEVLP